MTTRKLWYWTALDANGALHTGCTFASSRQVLDEMLWQQQRLQTLSVRRLARQHRFHHRDHERLIALFRQLGTLLHTGITLSDALRLLADGDPLPAWRALLADLRLQLNQGTPLATALQAWPDVFSPLCAAMIAVGELTGRLAACCEQLAAQQTRQRLLQQKVVKALRYPLLILLVALAVSAGMLLFVLPQFAAVYRSLDAPLPTFTRMLLDLAAALAQWGGAAPPLCGLALLLYRAAGRRYSSFVARQQRLLLRCPLLGPLWQGSQLARLYATLTLTQTAGLTLVQSLSAAERVLPPPLWQEAIAALRAHIAGGNTLHSGIAAQPLFTPLCRQLIRTGEESGTLDVLLERLAVWHEARSLERADSLAAAMEPVMLLLTGGLVGALVIGMYLPLFGLGDALSAAGG
ncbi:protein transport protein HofC [Pantoea sp. 1.19]|uniref:protein transport protein HofC n=1 Tax=Pantoea sp. 1.19 TaxID=1925589 RepID=UPI00094915DD|nr:protein transport protein HofC [Pantoea sp. 1.19]